MIDSKNYVDRAEEAIKKLNKNNYGVPFLTTTKIRKLLSMTAELSTQAQSASIEDFNNLRSKIEYLRVQFVYQAGRERDVKDFVDKADIVSNLNAARDDKEQFLLFCKYMEALVAYHRYYGGKDK